MWVDSPKRVGSFESDQQGFLTIKVKHDMERLVHDARFYFNILLKQTLDFIVKVLGAVALTI